MKKGLGYSRTRFTCVRWIDQANSLPRFNFSHLRAILSVPGAQHAILASRYDQLSVTPGDLAATNYHHIGVPLNTTHTARPRYIAYHGGPIRALA